MARLPAVCPSSPARLASEAPTLPRGTQRVPIPPMRALRLPALVLAASLLGSLASAQIDGAVYTTDVAGLAKDSFPKGPDVYLAGGPGQNAGCVGAGLADGLYYFQVTDPAGATLLSSDRLPDRIVRVVGGVFVSASSTHAVALGPCGSKIVQLYPFLRAPDGAGEYKVWITPVGSHVPGGPNFGFLSDKSKTDFFRLENAAPVNQAVIQGTVFFDYDQDGAYDPLVVGERPVPGWRVEIDGLGVTFTDQDGHYEFIRDENTIHVIDSIAPAPGYVGVVDGRWAPTTPISASVVAVAPVTTLDFGLLFLTNTPQFATSKQFWQHGGKPLLQAAGQRWRRVVNGLCLRASSTVPFPPPVPDPTLFRVPDLGPFDDAYDAFVRFLSGPSDHVLANILSKEYATAMLNASVGPLAQETVYIDRFDDSVLVPLEVMAADTLMLLCDPKSCDTGPNGDPAWLDKVLGCLHEWSAMNSNGENIYTRDSGYPPFVTPY